MNLLEEAIAFAAHAHAGQRDLLGRPYILHPLRVMLRLSDPREMAAAVLHDVLEDCDVTMEDLLTSGFPAEVVEAVYAMTRREGESYEAYVLRAGAHPVARRIKIADLQDNIERTLGMEPSAHREARYRRYSNALRLLGADPQAQAADAS